MRLAANLSMLFGEVGFLDRFEAAAAAGFTAVEYLFPYEYAPEDLASRLKANGLRQALFNLPAGDWASGDRGLACLPERIDEFREGVALAAEYASVLGCQTVNALAGIAPPGADPERLTETLVENLGYAAQELSGHGIKLVTEPINTIDIPGFFLTTTSQARGVLEQVESDNLLIQYDAYHMQIMEGDLARTIEHNFALIGHVQIADNPGRHEPGTGEINYPFLLEHLDRLGYGGFVGCEYRPAAGTVEGLNWAKEHLG